MNEFILLGNLTKDPELSETNSGKAVCRFSLAVNRKYADANGDRKTDFFNLTAFGPQAETIAKYFKKGRKILTRNHVEVDNWEDSTGAKRRDWKVIVDEFFFVNSSGAAVDSGDNPAPSSNTGSRKPPQQTFDDDEDIPF